MHRFAIAFGLTSALLGCRPSAGSASPDAEGEPAAAATGWHYRVRVSPDLARLDVRMCFDGAPPRTLIPGVDEAAKYLDTAATASGRKLKRRGKVLPLDELGDESCIDYAIDVARIVDESSRRRTMHLGDSLAMKTSQWLWRPPTLPAGAEITAQFELPEGIDVSVPWPVIRGGPQPTYAIDKTALEWLGYTILGDLVRDRFTHAGTRFDVVTLDAEIACTQRDVRRWLEDASDSVALLFDGKFPRERMQVVIVPVDGGGGGTVYFGMASRGGGPAIFVLLDDEATGERLPGGWTTVHEMLHHGMPFIRGAWMGEGWVSYYTELQRTRMGHRSEEDGWNALHDAFARGKRGGRMMTLRETSDHMRDTFAFQRVYWGGAAIAFLLDVELRIRSGNERSLDDAIEHLRTCCGDADERWDAQALLEELDRWYGEPIFTQIADEQLDSRDFPPVDEAMARLGISVGVGELVFDDDHPNAEIRRAIMAPRREP